MTRAPGNWVSSLPRIWQMPCKGKVVYIVAADPAGDDPSLAEALKSARAVIVQELFLTETAKLADVVLPAQAYTEREGSFTSGERRVQRFYPAVPPRGQARPDFAITAQVLPGIWPRNRRPLGFARHG